MAFVNLVPNLYRSIIEDVIEGVQDLFAEEGIEDQVLKDLKQLWETKVTQSKATEDFFRSRVPVSVVTVQLPHGFPPTLSSTGHLYKVNVPVMMTQSSGRAGVVPFQVFQQPSPLETPVPPVHPYSLPAAAERPPRTETGLQQPTILRKHLEKAPSHSHVLPGDEHPLVSQAVLLRQPESSPLTSLPPQVSPAYPSLQPEPRLPAGMALSHHSPDLQPHGLQTRMHACDLGQHPRDTEEPSSLPASEKNSNSEVDLNIQVTDDDINEIIQIDGTGDTSSNEELGRARDVDENEFLRTVHAGDLKVLEEADRVSNEGSTADNSDSEDCQIGLVEEDPLNSGDDVSEQDVPDLFDTDNVIVCQYDKIHRSKNRWKFYLRDGIMCFGGRDYVFARATGDAEW